MGIFSRLVQVIKSNLNDLLNRSEDAEKMLNQVVSEMADQLISAKKQVAGAIADEKRLSKQLEQEQANATDWEKRAMLALKANDEPLAREALVRKRDHEGLAANFHEQWSKQHAAVEQLKTALSSLNDKIEETKRKKNLLIARKTRAAAQQSIQETMSGLRDQGAFSTFERMAAKVDQIEAEAEAHAELAEQNTGDALASRFSKLERDAGADDELLMLKQKMGLSLPAAPWFAELPVHAEVDANLVERSAEATFEDDESDKTAPRRVGR